MKRLYIGVAKKGMQLRKPLLHIPVHQCCSSYRFVLKYVPLRLKSLVYQRQMEKCLQVLFTCAAVVICWSLPISTSRGPLSQTALQTSTPICLVYSAHHQLWVMNQTTPVLLSHYSLHSQTQNIVKAADRLGARYAKRRRALGSQWEASSTLSPSPSRFHAPSLTFSHFGSLSLSFTPCLRALQQSKQQPGWGERSAEYKRHILG